MNLATYCQTSSIQQLFFLTLFEAWVERCFQNSVLCRAKKNYLSEGQYQCPQHLQKTPFCLRWILLQTLPVAVE